MAGTLAGWITIGSTLSCCCGGGHMLRRPVALEVAIIAVHFPTDGGQVRSHAMVLSELKEELRGRAVQAVAKPGERREMKGRCGRGGEWYVRPRIL